VVRARRLLAAPAPDQADDHRVGAVRLTNDEVGVYRPSNATFYLLFDSGTVYTEYFGNLNDPPLLGDWDSDGYDDLGLFRSSTYTFYFQTIDDWNNEIVRSVSYGAPTDTRIIGDWDGQGGSSQGVVRSA
jgi:hypothetical protein